MKYHLQTLKDGLSNHLAHHHSKGTVFQVYQEEAVHARLINDGVVPTDDIILSYTIQGKVITIGNLFYNASSVTEAQLLKQIKKFCKWCGHKDRRIRIQLVSETGLGDLQSKIFNIIDQWR